MRERAAEGLPRDRVALNALRSASGKCSSPAEADGLSKRLGVSNFTLKQTRYLMREGGGKVVIALDMNTASIA